MDETWQGPFLALRQLLHGLEPILVPLCFVMAWVTVGSVLWSLFAMLRDGFKRAQTMHQIPCSQCRYFSGNYLLKCPVHPQQALSEAAIGCPDFESTQLDHTLQRSHRGG